MKMGNAIRLGDGSDHGGTMISAGSTVVVNGVQLCLDQDMYSCPIPYHGITPATASSSVKTTDGKRVIKIGDIAGCGATIIQGSPTLTVG